MDASPAFGAALGPRAPRGPEDGLRTGDPFIAEPVDCNKNTAAMMERLEMMCCFSNGQLVKKRTEFEGSFIILAEKKQQNKLQLLFTQLFVVALFLPSGSTTGVRPAEASLTTGDKV